MDGITCLFSARASKVIFVSGSCSLWKVLPKVPSSLHSCKLPREGLIVARLGNNGYRPRPPGGSRRSPRTPRIVDSDYDPGLDLDRVQSASVRLIDEQQNMVGIYSKGEAIQMAEDAELILAILSADADPPVLRLFESSDYKQSCLHMTASLCQLIVCNAICCRKHKYEQQKKKRVQLKRSAANRVDTKELKMGYNIDSHDYSVRLKAAQKFLRDEDKVKVIVNLKGRENEFRNFAIELIKRFQNDVGEASKLLIIPQLAIEESKSFSERNIYIVLAPNKAALQKAQELSKKETSTSEVSVGV